MLRYLHLRKPGELEKRGRELCEGEKKKITKASLIFNLCLTEAHLESSSSEAKEKRRWTSQIKELKWSRFCHR